jgi:hypothetical protein
MPITSPGRSDRYGSRLLSRQQTSERETVMYSFGEEMVIEGDITAIWQAVTDAA